MSNDQFETNKAALIQEIKESFNKVSYNLDKLQQNLDIVQSISKQFREPSNVWSTFYNDTVNEFVEAPQEEGNLSFFMLDSRFAHIFFLKAANIE
jgi:hypothetical protein